MYWLLYFLRYNKYNVIFLQEEDKEEMKEIMEMKRIHLKNVEKRRKGRKYQLVDTPSPKRMDLNNPKSPKHTTV